MNEHFYPKRKRKPSFRRLLCAALCLLVTMQATGAVQSRGLASQKLGDFLKLLEKQYQVSFVYDASQISKEAVIEADRDASPLEKALNQLRGNGIDYKIISNKVILKKVDRKEGKQNQDLIVRGTVTIQTKAGSEATPGVYVLEKGTKNGVITGVNGEYTIRVNNGATLVYSMIGYKTREVAVQGRSSIDVTLAEDVSALEEVVVTGYQNISKKLFTGSAVSVKGADIKQEGITDVSRMLEGRVAGVSVQNVSGTFGAAPKIRVRGATSITGENKPLWVVDGVVLEDVVNISNEQLSTGDPSTLIGSSVAGLNADDIASIDILKDAAATAQYGARAMNGVVVITTKKGHVGKPLVSYTGNLSTYLKPSYSNYNIMNSADQMSVNAEMERKGFFNHSTTSRAENGGVFTKMYQLIDSYDPATGFGLENTAEAKSAFLKRYALANTDWFDVLFKNSLLQEHSLSIQSGTEKSQFYVSTSFLDDNGWAAGNNVNRYTANINANFNFSPKISANFITTGSIRDQQAPGTVTRVSNPVEGRYSRDFDINPFSYALNTSRTTTAYDENGNREFFTMNFAPFNILNELDNNTLDLNMLDLKLQGDISYKITKDLKYNLLGSMRYVNTSRDHKVRENSNMALAYRAGINGDAYIAERNRFLYRDPDDPEALPVSVLPYGGFYNTNVDYLKSYVVRNSLDFNKTINNTHIMSFYALQEARFADRTNKMNVGYGYQFGKGGVPYIDPNAVKQAVQNNMNYYGIDNFYDRFAAFMARAAYSYKGIYAVNVTGRYDGANQLGSSRTARWLPTWNVSGAWNIDQEEFMPKNTWINRATLRATYGLTASLGAATNSSLILRSGTSLRPYLDESESVLIIEALGNRDLTWEKQYEANIGLDLGLFQERLTLSLDVYNRNGFDLISMIKTSGIGGQRLKPANYADMNSKGVEFSLGGRIIDGRDWGWRSNLNFGYNTNKVTNLKNVPQIFDLVVADGGAMKGRPYRGLYSVEFVGLKHEDGTPLFINQEGEVSGDVYLQDDETQYLKYEGSVDPKLTGGFYNAVKYKSFSLSALITFSAGNVIRLNPVFSDTYSDQTAMPKEFYNRWTLPGDEEYTNIPSLASIMTNREIDGTYPYNNYNYSSARIAKGDFVRLKQVAFTYAVLPQFLKGIGVSNASISVVANNPYLIYADKKLNGQDPEFFSSGGVALPIPRQYTLSLKLGI